MRGEVRQRLVEIGLRRGGDAVGILPQKDLVHVEFENLFLWHRFLKPGGEDDLLDLAFDLTITGEQEVLHHLLRDCRSTAHVLPARSHSFDHRGGDAARVIPGVGVEILVFRRNEGVFHEVRNLVRGGKKSPLHREFVDDPALGRIDPADRLGLVGGEALVAGQIAAINPKDCPDAQRDHSRAKCHEAEDRPEER